jgi:DNA polymerase II small subunit/DNA polymerase delta subunit B
MAYSTREKQQEYSRKYYNANRDRILKYKRDRQEKDNRRRRARKQRKKAALNSLAARAWCKRVREAVEVTQIVNYFASKIRAKKQFVKPNYRVLNTYYKRYSSGQWKVFG